MIEIEAIEPREVAGGRSSVEPARVTQAQVDEGFRRWQGDLSSGGYAAAVLVAAALFVVPLVLMLSASVRPRDVPYPTVIELVPPGLTLANYEALFTLLPLARYALNSLIVAAVAVPLTLVFASWAAFAMAQLPARLRDLLASVSVATLLVPIMALWVTRFLVFKWIGVLDTLMVLMIPAIIGTSPFYVLMLFWAFRRVPGELYEAARLDGAHPLQIWWLIGVPLVRPTMVAVAILSFVYYWSNFIDPMLYIQNNERHTLPVGLQLLQQMHRSEWPLLMAGAVLVTLPVVIVFLLAQRAFLQEHRGGGWFGR